MTNNDHAAAIAGSWLGTPYRHQASVCGAGCDCLGLLRGVWRKLYGCEPVVVPAYAVDPRRDADLGLLQQAADQFLIPAETIAPGSVLLFRLARNLPPRHCGIATGRGSFIHAQERLGVIETCLSASWQRRLSGLYAFPETERTEDV